MFHPKGPSFFELAKQGLFRTFGDSNMRSADAGEPGNQATVLGRCPAVEYSLA